MLDDDDDDDDDDTATIAQSTPLPSPAAAAAAARGGIEALTIAKMRAELASGPAAALGLGGAGDAIPGIRMHHQSSHRLDCCRLLVIT